MYYCYGLAQAREAHQQHGGVLLDFDDLHIVCSFNDAVELRWEETTSPRDLAAYWAVMAECDYDETDPVVRRFKALLAGENATAPVSVSRSSG
ncbi:MAG: hypothetical protein PHO07_05480 [Pirellulales bacterium]|jgi:hypothetical protein|nr:hypothetical protein [Thermoguttaceae bacterium]MDD4786607.1 hypothetical protein [Pirellulales bacterium]MDI9446166.1 hypothetical protein [Planctomycetota bacterium]NLY99346.1 hypothetical protein [Pirellulaceae bacterium]